LPFKACVPIFYNPLTIRLLTCLSIPGDVVLTPEQREKLAGEKAILEELASLGA
jgi:hypothetical protein